jgi:hypothetical protein
MALDLMRSSANRLGRLISSSFGSAILPATFLTDEDGDPIKLSAPTCLGHYTIAPDISNASNDLGALLTAVTSVDTLGTAITAGLQAVLVTVEAQNIKVTFNGTDPTTNGLLFIKDNGQPYVWDAANFASVRIVGVGGTATLRIALFA